MQIDIQDILAIPVVEAASGVVLYSRSIYFLRVECDADLLGETLVAFEEVAKSVQPAPERSADLDPDMDVLASWVD